MQTVCFNITINEDQAETLPSGLCSLLVYACQAQGKRERERMYTHLNAFKNTFKNKVPVHTPSLYFHVGRAEFPKSCSLRTNNKLINSVYRGYGLEEWKNNHKQSTLSRN